jgi:hypothetical protein
MKLRIQGNSLRLRLTRNEVARLGEQGLVEDTIRFSTDRAITYSVAALASEKYVSIRYIGDSICVFLSAKIASEWVKNDEVTIEAVDSGVRILVEKDFQCLHPSEASDPEGYPNPLAKAEM